MIRTRPSIIAAPAALSPNPIVSIARILASSPLGHPDVPSWSSSESLPVGRYGHPGEVASPPIDTTPVLAGSRGAPSVSGRDRERAAVQVSDEPGYQPSGVLQPAHRLTVAARGGWIVGDPELVDRIAFDDQQWAGGGRRSEAGPIGP